uniref:Uncharacterized protein n=1 Tax=Brassica oleracea TaxID=3712 RepID=A0A3P6DNB7_BRAOL|nr:unnamed protein product [Brassica oleracea]
MQKVFGTFMGKLVMNMVVLANLSLLVNFSLILG